MIEKQRKEDRRTRYTRQLIRETLLKLLEKKAFPRITVTEICKLAEINRGTFYLHYYDTEDVLDDILTEMLKTTKSVPDHLMCPKRTHANCSYPFCDKIHENEHYRFLFLDDTISSKIIEKMAEMTKEDYITWLMSHSLLTYEEAEAVFYFQMNGCLNINKLTLRNHCSDWKKIQKTIDTFIKAGLESFLIHDQRDEIL
ncbi:MAG: TetR/AcrR family transcriptional regulator [Lachnospiraceae bacterium]|nr:TetR/AcrR family transcriptional regulator [Lachnospiraceae bacterium]